MAPSEDDPFGDSSAAEDELSTTIVSGLGSEEDKAPGVMINIEPKTEIKPHCASSPIGHSAAGGCQFLGHFPSPHSLQQQQQQQQIVAASLYNNHPSQDGNVKSIESMTMMAPPQALAAAWMGIAYGSGGGGGAGGGGGGLIGGWVPMPPS
jgi:hypothetical protein